MAHATAGRSSIAPDAQKGSRKRPRASKPAKAIEPQRKVQTGKPALRQVRVQNRKPITEKVKRSTPSKSRKK